MTLDVIGALLVIPGFFLFSGGKRIGYALYIAGELFYVGYGFVAEPRGWGLIGVSLIFIALGIRDWKLRNKIRDALRDTEDTGHSRPHQ